MHIECGCKSQVTFTSFTYFFTIRPMLRWVSRPPAEIQNTAPHRSALRLAASFQQTHPAPEVGFAPARLFS